MKMQRKEASRQNAQARTGQRGAGTSILLTGEQAWAQLKRVQGSCAEVSRGHITDRFECHVSRSWVFLSVPAK